MAAALRFCSVETCDWPLGPRHLPPRIDRQRLPRGLRVEERQRLLPAPRPPTHRARLRPTSAAGLRGSEVVRLQVTDIARDRRLIRVTQAKGTQERYPLLSTRCRTALRAYWPLLWPPRWLVPGRRLTEAMPSASARKIDA